MKNKKYAERDNLSPIQEKIMDLVASESSEGMTLREMADAVDMDSHNTIVHHLKQLEKKGYIQRKPGGEIKVLAKPIKDIIYLPLYGEAVCGPNGTLNDDLIETRIPFPAKQLSVSPNVFLVRAKNDSMKPKIEPDDLVLVKPETDLNRVADTEELALVEYNEEALIKKIQVDDNSGLILQSLNTAYKPKFASKEEVKLIGVVEGVLRHFSKK